jgi:tRNA uridine 5-carboxymethylaminomethyl modification enzyme
MVGSARADRFRKARGKIDAARMLAKEVHLTPNEAARLGLDINQNGVRRSAYDLLRYAGVDMAWLARMDARFASIDPNTAEALEIEAKYAVYLDRQAADVAQIVREERRMIPVDLDFSRVSGLSNELKQKMRDRRPRSVADAQRMEGMTPAALALIVAHVRNAETRRAGAA